MDYEIQFSYMGIWYTATCDIMKEGAYSYVPQDYDDPGGLDVEFDPSFYNWTFVDCDTGLETEPCGGMMMIAEAVVLELYWDRVVDQL